jgi:hypothetical protein
MNDVVNNEVKEKLDIHAIKKVSEGLDVILTAGFKIGADGKIDQKDIVPAIELLKGTPIIVAAAGELKEVLPEAKDLDQAELVEIGMLYYGMIKNYIQIIKDTHQA